MDGAHSTTCPNCFAGLELSAVTWSKKKYECPECKHVTVLSTSLEREPTPLPASSVMVLPESTSHHILPADPTPFDGWKCSVCGEMNARYASRCIYGAEFGADLSSVFSGFNFGGAFLTPVWLLFNGKAVLALAVIAYWAASRFLFPGAWVLDLAVGLSTFLYFGFKGNQIAADYHGYDSLEDLRRGQRRWNVAGIVVACINVLVVILVFS